MASDDRDDANRDKPAAPDEKRRTRSQDGEAGRPRDPAAGGALDASGARARRRRRLEREGWVDLRETALEQRRLEQSGGVREDGDPSRTALSDATSEASETPPGETPVSEPTAARDPSNPAADDANALFGVVDHIGAAEATPRPADPSATARATEMKRADASEATATQAEPAPLGASLGVVAAVPADRGARPIHNARALDSGALEGTLWGLDATALDVTVGGAKRALRRRPQRYDTEDAAELARLDEADQHERRALRDSIGRLDRVVQTVGREGRSTALPAAAAAALRVLETYGYDPAREELDYDRLRDARLDVFSVARHVGAATRTLQLPSNWRRVDHGHFVGFLLDDGAEQTAEEASAAPVALISRPSGGYLLYEAGASAPRRVTAALAERLTSTAIEVLPPLPRKVSGFIDLARFVLPMVRRELTWVVVAGLVTGLIGAVAPIATGVVIDRLIPGQEQALLIQVGVALLLGSVLALFFSIMSQLMLLRIGGRVGMVVDAALWRRVLDLPSSFFKTYAAGDLRSRIGGVAALRQAVISVALSAIVTASFSLFYLALLFAYDARLASVAFGLVAVMVGATFVVSILQLKYYKRQAELGGWLSGYVFQLLQAIVKLRVAGAEDRAFVRWADKFADARAANLTARRISSHFGAFADLYSTLTMAILFAGAYHLSADRPTPGTFIAFLAAFGGFQAAFHGLSDAALTLITTLPNWERAKPLLTTEPEVRVGAADPGPLSGEIEIASVSFSYPDGPPVLREVSMQIGAGEYAALVGPSGSGKSTLVRLILGLERPSIGAVLFDGQDLDGLDLTAVRRQIGVVTQSGKLAAGTIFDNVRGATDATLEQCFEACVDAGFADDLKQLPMGLHTPLTEGAPTLSGGQRQRLLIARALVHKPKILVFDEATSALDNRTQAIVTASLGRLQATRLVIAHRLSTIRDADSIHVMEAGRLVESGAYDELMVAGGVFAQLAARQVT